MTLKTIIDRAAGMAKDRPKREAAQSFAEITGCLDMAYAIVKKQDAENKRIEVRVKDALVDGTEEQIISLIYRSRA